MRLTQIVEALLFASDAPLTAADIARVDERLDEDTVDAVVQELRAEYDEAEHAFQIYEIAGGYQLLTRPDFATYLERYETIPQTAKLSMSGLEVLAIIAYRQPIGRGEIEEIRGVGSSGSIKTLLDRGLIEVAGRGEGLGRPLLYGTTSKFLEHFGFRSLEDLPRPEELPVVLRTRAPRAPVAESPESSAEPAEQSAGSAEPSPEAASEPAAETDAAAIEAERAVPGESAANVEKSSEAVGDGNEVVDDGNEAVDDGYAAAVHVDESEETVTAFEDEPAEVDAVAQAPTEEDA